MAGQPELTEDLFRLLTEHASDLIRLHDLEGRTIYSSLSAKALYGTSPYDLFEPVHPDDLPKARRWWKEVLAGGSDRIQGRVRDTGGKWRWVEGAASLVELQGERFVLSVCREVSEQKEAEETLRRSERVLREAEQLGQTGSWEHDLATGRTFSSEENLRLFFGDTRGKGGQFEDYESAIHPDDREYVLRHHEQLIAEECPRDIEYRVVWPDGSVRTIFGRASVVRNRKGEPIRVYGTNVDVTERRRAEEAFRRAEELFRAIVEDQNEMIVRWKPDGTRTFVNQAYCRMFGKSYDALVGSSFWPLIAEPYREEEKERIRALTPESPFSTGVHESALPDGTRRWQEWTDRAIFDDQGRLIEMQSVGRDITEARKAEQALRESADRLHHLSRRLLEVQEEERRRLSRELHDEFGQLLASISMHLHAAKSLAGEAARPRLEECVSLLQRAGSEMRNLALELRPTMLETAGLDATIRWLVEQHQRQSGVNIHIDGRLDDVAGDPATACFRVTQEALTNIVRHANARSVWIEMALQDNVIELIVRDDGDGFDMAKALEEATRRGSLGLLGMRERVEILGGQLEIESHPGDGTCIHVHLPIPEDQTDPTE